MIYESLYYYIVTWRTANSGSGREIFVSCNSDWQNKKLDTHGQAIINIEQHYQVITWYKRFGTPPQNTILYRKGCCWWGVKFDTLFLWMYCSYLCFWRSIYIHLTMWEYLTVTKTKTEKIWQTSRKNRSL